MTRIIWNLSELIQGRLGSNFRPRQSKLWLFEDAFMKTHKRDAEMKKKFVRANEAPYITKKTNYENVWTER